MTSAYQQQLVQQLRAAEDELARWRQSASREAEYRRHAETADRYRAAWLSARRRAEAYGEGIVRLCEDRDTIYDWLREAESAVATLSLAGGGTPSAVLVTVDGPGAAAAAVRAVGEATARTEQAEARTAAVRALHRAAECFNVHCALGQWCIGCAPEGLESCAEHPWPCPTLAALDGVATAPVAEAQP